MAAGNADQAHSSWSTCFTITVRLMARCVPNLLLIWTMSFRLMVQVSLLHSNEHFLSPFMRAASIRNDSCFLKSAHIIAPLEVRMCTCHTTGRPDFVHGADSSSPSIHPSSSSDIGRCFRATAERLRQARLEPDGYRNKTNNVTIHEGRISLT